MTRPILHVCTTCRAGQTLAEDDPRPGQLMLDALAALAPDVDLRPVTCLSACDQGCTAAITMPGKWTYILGRLDPALAADLVEYAGIYAAHPTGSVLPSRRPASLARMVVGRVPA